jgi:hypothetical protein
MCAVLVFGALDHMSIMSVKEAKWAVVDTTSTIWCTALSVIIGTFAREVLAVQVVSIGPQCEIRGAYVRSTSLDALATMVCICLCTIVLVAKFLIRVGLPRHVCWTLV